MSNNVKLTAFKVSQQIGDFFVAKIKAKDLVKISYRDVRELTNERDVETYLGIQRPLNKPRAKEIKEYVKNIDATFPTSIILSIDAGSIDWNESTSVLSINFDESSSPAKILDGQHRVAGFMDLETGNSIKELCFFERDGKRVHFELIVTIFVGLDLSEQATIFSTVNLKQTKVSKSLVYDLESYAQTRSPQKSAHDIVVTLDSHSKSPFYNRIKRLGLKEGEFETITQATLVEEIISLISSNAMADRDILLRQEKNTFSLSRKGLIKSDFHDGKVFRNLFIDNKDDEILKIIMSFFISVEKVWPNAWDRNNQKSVLNKTVGIKALFRVLRDLCQKQFLINESSSMDVSYFENMFSRTEIKETFFESLDAKSATISTLYTEITKELGNLE